nr:Rdx family protein [Desulfobulbaceae bacterium]
MGDHLKKQLGAQVTLIAGSDGIFDVEVNGKVIFSKKKIGRFPESNEIVSLIGG